MKRILIVILGAALLVGCGSNTTKETTQPTTVATSVAPTATPVEPTAVPVMPTAVPAEPTAMPEGIVPCTDGTQESCEVWQAVFSGQSQAFPGASIAWVDCIAVYVSNNYTKEQFQVIDTNQLAIAAAEVCGLP